MDLVREGDKGRGWKEPATVAKVVPLRPQGRRHEEHHVTFQSSALGTFSTDLH